MRLFVAVDPPANAREHLRTALPSDPALRWTDPATWHITLAFLGEVDAGTAAALDPALAAVAQAAHPVELRLEGSGVFAQPGGAALWVGVVGELAPLAAAVAAAARATGIALEDRPFRPHLTVARSRGARPSRDLLASYSGPTWVADELRLVRSHLGKPLRHVQLGRWPLGG